MTNVVINCPVSRMARVYEQNSSEADITWLNGLMTKLKLYRQGKAKL